MRPPSGFTGWPGGRALGLAARHDGTYATLSVGGSAYNAAASGFKIEAGLLSEALVSLIEGDTPPEAMLRVLGNDGRTSVMLRGGATPALAFGLAGTDANALDAGVLRFSGPLGRAPLINVAGSGPDATLLAARPDADDESAGFRVAANGRIEWTDNPAAAPVALTARDGRLTVDGGIEADSLRVGERGTFLRSVRVVPAEIEPAAMPGHATDEQVLPAPGMPASAIVCVNGPPQPKGVALAGARSIGNDQIALVFVNVSAGAARPAQGKYLFLVLEPMP